MRVIGTAGHVDHGKSTLIAALTGVHPDRLKEEQEREMTIELGFGWLTLPDGEEIGIVDVPGHRDFIGNMLAGIGGIDAVVLVIAADEGVMPQTKEHLAILDLLQIPSGMVALTKTDLVPDAEWLDLVEAEIRESLAGTVLANAPFVRVSAKLGTGLENLLETLSKLLKEKPERLDLGRPRLPIDRAFSISGFGTVVTGTLADGNLSLGDEVLVLPSTQKGRVRGLQTHKKKEEISIPGSRTAVNISGISLEDIRRGEVVIKPGQYETTRRLDAQFRLLDDISQPIKHDTEVKLFVGASETIATLRLLGAEILNPGEEAWIQLELRDPIITVRGDRYILRRPSPAETLGGGVIIDHQPKGRHKRFDERIIEKLTSLAEGSPADVLYEASLANGADTLSNLIRDARLEEADAQEAVEELFVENKIFNLNESGALHLTDALHHESAPESRTATHPKADAMQFSLKDFVIATTHWDALKERTLNMVRAYHEKFPLRRGVPREELKSRLKIKTKLFNAMIENLLKTEDVDDAYRSVQLPGHRITFGSTEQAKISGLMRQFDANPFAPPTIKSSTEEVGEEIFNALLALEEFVQLSPEVVFRKSDYEKAIDMLREYLAKNGKITVADARDLYGTSRRYVLALLEHLDSQRVTMRDGDFRKLR
ncbi:MAG: selenocysteine-specific translation elongation factor [Anaerolineae bacterium]|jgi:selenocysteine-specific elongation factor|nr:selenocysteine-specific translation elongation factor [Anaerolineae bacterium]MBT7072865.1 selenocysteine-specific translation elongation factor [Anaerolineae bacterium]MBT7326304.1 selenocysteine-specific translation elongation factor [Anaerolineae bacterium]